MNTSKLSNLWSTKKNYAVVFLVNFLIIYASYALCIIQHISTDGYYLAFGNDTWAPWSAGRVVWGLLLQGLTAIGVNVFQSQEIFVVFFIVSLAWCSVRILQYTNSDFSIGEGILCSIPILLGFINICIQEWFIFAEATLFYSIGFITAVEAAIAVSKRRYILSLTLLIVSVLCYQILLSLFIVYALFLVYITNEGRKIRSYIPSVFIGGIAGIVIIAAQKLSVLANNIETIRGADLSFFSILSRVPTVLKGVWDMILDAQGTYPIGILPLVILFSLLLIVIHSIKTDSSRCFFDLFALILIIFVSLGVVCAPILLSTENVWTPPRVLVGVTTLGSMIILCAFLRSRGFTRMLLTACTLLLLFINIFSSQAISVDMFKNNTIDYHLDQQARAYVERYEQATGNTIEHIAFYNDSTFSWGFPEIHYIWYDTNVRSILIDWERIYRINYNFSRSFTLAEPSEEIFDTYFAGKDWNVFMPDEQFIFIGDTLHWCIY